MNRKYKTLVKNLLLFTLGNFGSKLITFFLLPLYTYVLSTSDYGTVDIIQSTVQLLMPILLLSIQDATLRFSMDSNYEKSDVLSTSVNVILKGSFALLIGTLVLAISGIIRLSASYWVFLFISFLVGSFNNCLNLYLKAKNNATVIAISGIICTIVTCLSNVMFLLIFKLGINGYIISYILGLIFQFLFLFFAGKIYKDLHIKNYKNLSKPMIKYSTPLIANSISWWINNASDRYILIFLKGVAVNGVYAVSYKIPTILTSFQSIFYNAWSISAISEFNKNDDDGFIGNNYTIFSFMSILVCSFILLINIPLSKILYSNNFYSAWQFVPFLLLSTVFSGISQLEGSLFAATKETRSVMVTTILGAIVNTIGNLVLINLIGALGAAIATFLGYLTTWIFRTIILKKLVKMKVNWNIHIMSLILLLVQTCLATFNKFYIIQVFIIILIVVLYRNYIIIVLNKLVNKFFKKSNSIPKINIAK